MIFKYKGIKKDGKKIKSEIEAQNLNDAKRKLKAQNIIYQYIKEQNPSIFKNLNFSFSKKYTLKPKELANFSRDLSIYIKSGISIVNAIKLSKNQYAGNKKLSLFLETVITFLDEGKNFYQALDEQTVIELPTFYKQSIKVSEDSGILDEVLIELSKFLKDQDAINKEIQSAFAYPMFIMVVSIFMVAFMITYVVPKITGIFDQMGQALPPITEFVINLSDWFQNYWLAGAITIITVVSTMSILIKTNKKVKYAVDRVLLKVPLFGKVIETSELARFAYISSVLFRSGVPFVQTIKLSANILKNSVISEVFQQASQKVVEGGKLSVALNNSDVKIDRSFIQAIALGEETSEVTEILKNLSELYFEENRDKIGILLSLLEPFLMLFVGGAIGFIVTAMLLPIFSMNIG